MSETSPPLVVNGLGVELGGRKALHDVDLRVDDGEIVGLIGPNGAGKTTLLRAVLTLVPTVAGQITIEGRTPAKARGTIGYVPQRHEFAWDFPISVRNAVRSALTNRVTQGSPRSRRRAAVHEVVTEALRRVDLTALGDRPIGELSGGQRQRVLVARALVSRPRLLLLDEPFTGLDVPTQELLTRLFGELRGEGRAVLMTTHDLPSAAAMADRLVLLNKTVVIAGPPEQLREPSVWLRAFGVVASEQLLHTLGVDS
ncbi:manganese/iron transport system ATP-binding protein [Actinoalloteichus hoggarensis]|uniref:Zinc import ATP-binding protein ZnuC n=1 Tax=Actinoalloteichus hoggarensis TaxID=1470176 RepID=A0A221W857_9PSEU|nr:anchored repeat-type ABC transporter ATP-binding subunit [Actinoalloteichus hoggarensis]ASO21517.1 Zinc import ATP-binding protein ZnuC [Actinoalloteichus hoggarensis]MBB5922106.1 manganese/iron transport system ATP-binding protein [Actinoalloteichus hoggarensis]